MLMSGSIPRTIPVLLLVAACGGPAGVIPGGELSGEEATAAAWRDVVSESGTLDLETRPADPYSVRINYVFRDGNVYIGGRRGRVPSAMIMRRCEAGGSRCFPGVPPRLASLVSTSHGRLA